MHRARSHAGKLKTSQIPTPTRLGSSPSNISVAVNQNQSTNGNNSVALPVEGNSLKDLLTILNGSPVDFGLNRDMCMADLNKLSSGNMVKIVSYLVGMVQPSQISMHGIMEEFEEFQIGDASYNASLDQVYHKAKIIFDQLDVADNALHFSVFLIPWKYPKRTKLVLMHLFNFVMMCDTLDPLFRERFGHIQNEIKEMANLYGDLEQQKDELGQVIVDKENEKRRVPILKREVEIINASVLKVQLQQAELNDRVATHQHIYEGEERKIRQLVEKLEVLEVDISEAQGHLVDRPEDIKREHEKLKRELKHESEKRKYGHKVENVSHEVKQFEKRLKRAQEVLQEFQNVIKKLENVKTKKEFVLKEQKSSKKLAKQNEKMQMELANLTKEHDKLLEEMEQAKASDEDKMRQYDMSIVEKNKKTRRTARKTEQVKVDVVNIKADVNKIKTEISELQKLIERYNHIIGVEMPKLRAEAEMMARDHLLCVKTEFIDNMPTSFSDDDDK